MPKPKKHVHFETRTYINRNGKKIILPSSALDAVYRFYPVPHEDSYTRTNLYNLICDNQLRLTGPGEVNDPFECNPAWIDDLPGNKAAQELASIAKRNANSIEFQYVQNLINRKAPNRKARRAAKDLQAFAKYSSRSAVLQHFKDQGFASFTARKEHPLLWAHYADSHGGLMVEFKTKPPNDNGGYEDLPIGARLLEVRYSDVRPTITASMSAKHFTGDDTQNTVLLDAISTKPPYWRYEEEWRYVGDLIARRANPKKGDMVDVGNDAISSITFGLNASEQTKNFVTNLVGTTSRSITLKQAYLSPREFKILSK